MYLCKCLDKNNRIGNILEATICNLRRTDAEPVAYLCKVGCLHNGVCTHSFCKLSLVEADLDVNLVVCLLEQRDGLLVLLGLHDDFLDGALLLAQDLDGLGVTPLLLVTFQLNVADLQSRATSTSNYSFMLTTLLEAS
jgi:hypothetical protein